MKNTIQHFSKFIPSYKKGFLFAGTICFLFVSQIQAQNKKQEELIQQFDNFKQGFKQQHQDFIDKNDSLFILFLKNSWKKVALVKGDARPSIKPTQQPVQLDTIFKLQELKIDTVQAQSSSIPLAKLDASWSVDEPVAYASVSYMKGFNFYGIESSFDVRPNLLPQLRSISSESITEFYSGLAKNNDYWKEQVLTLQTMRSKYQLNDWGFFQLSSKAANVFYEGSNERKLLSWYILLKSGFKVKVGYNDDLVCLLFPTKEKLFSVPYFREGDEMYYVIDENKSRLNEIETYDQNYPGNSKPVSLALKTYPLLQGDRVARQVNYKNNKLDFTFNRGVMEFLASYPQCDLKVYFGPGLNTKNAEVMDGFLKPRLTGKSKRESIDLLLDFCQLAFPYETDQSQFGKEKYLFAEETLYFPANDCEDRTVFLSYLVKRYLSLETIALDFPGHVNLAVNLNEPITGTYINYNGAKYLICDPTYINAKSGMLSSSYMNQKAKIINLDK
jgi:hypothetical protein